MHVIGKSGRNLLLTAKSPLWSVAKIRNIDRIYQLRKYKAQNIT